jgi:hypothetical protein
MKKQPNKVFQSGAIMIGMSEGGSENVSFESDSSYKKNQEICEAYE